MSIEPTASTTGPVAGGRSDAFLIECIPENYARFLAPALFEPWAQMLLERATPSPGATVLDVASGTGVVARLAAKLVGPSGRVVASDISAEMLAAGAAKPVDSGSAPIEWVSAPATNLGFPDHRFNAVLCQQGLPFFTDRIAAVHEMRRVLRPRGLIGLAVWASGRPLFPFREYTEALKACGIPAPFAAAYDGNSYVMDETDVTQLLTDAGFSAINTQTGDLHVSWPDRHAVAAGILGTPFGPLVSALPDAPREAFMDDLAARISQSDERPVTRPTTAVIATALA
jgi:ubiquinone/menaquinone biosynthesis C-methylase UbiE